MSKIDYSTQLIKVETGEYPVYLNQLRNTNPTVSIAITPSEESVQSLGYAVVQSTATPVGDVVTQGPPELVEGVYRQTWVVRPFTPEEIASNLEQKRAEHLYAIKQYETAYLEKGFPYEFNGNTYHVQLRDGDIGRITGVRIKADALIAANITDPVMPFRVYENVVLQLTPQQASDLADAAFVGYTTFLSSVWDLSDLTRLADSVEDFPVIPTL